MSGEELKPELKKKAESIRELKNKEEEGNITEKEKEKLKELEKPLKKIDVKVTDALLRKARPKKIAKFLMIAKGINKEQKKEKMKKAMKNHIEAFHRAEQGRKRMEEGKKAEMTPKFVSEINKTLEKKKKEKESKKGRR